MVGRVGERDRARLEDLEREDVGDLGGLVVRSMVSLKVCWWYVLVGVCREDVFDVNLALIWSLFHSREAKLRAFSLEVYAGVSFVNNFSS